MGLLDQSLISIMALGLGLIMTPVARLVALRLNLVDRPAARKLHLGPVPLLGGIAIYLAVVLALVALVDSPYLPQLVAPLIGGSLISLLGLWDDHRGMKPGIKIGAQAFIAAGVIISGFHVELFEAEWANFALTAFWILGITNAFNLMDNMDGLSSGIGAVASSFLVFFSFLTGQYVIGCIAAAILGATLGFLFFNFDPARIFMGDAGSLFLGFMLALVGLGLRFPTNPTYVSWMIPVFVLGLPIFDTTLVTISRIRRGQAVWVGGKDHVSHRLLALGWSTRQAVSVLYAMGLACGLVAVGLHFLDPSISLVLAGVSIAVGCVSIWFFEVIYRNGLRETNAPGRDRPRAHVHPLPVETETDPEPRA